METPIAHRVIISPPFGTYIASPRAVSVLGSYTRHERKGRGRKILQFAYDNWRYPIRDGWRNRIGLRNPGIEALGYLFEDCIYSLVGLEDDDWETMLDVLDVIPRLPNTKITLEINLGCPNVHEYGIPQRVLSEYCHDYTVIAKLPAEILKAIPIARMCAEAGVHYLHCSNTFQDPYAPIPGGLSGYPLKLVNLGIVEYMANSFPSIPIIGGGGIYEWKDYLDYKSAGATYFSMGTVWFHPLKARSLLRRIHEDLEGTENASNSQPEPSA
jgi:dihydroorotate dehydrogenase (NAD+) catalytic subunit